jgi:hypothetical protein
MGLSGKLNNSIEFSNYEEAVMHPLNEIFSQTVILMFNFWHQNKQSGYMKKNNSFGFTKGSSHRSLFGLKKGKQKN